MWAFSWDDKYKIGHDVIDRQHFHLFSLINGLHAAMKSGNSDDSLDDTLKGLIDYTRWHFATEEEVMESIHFPELEEHRAQHQLLTAKVRSLQRSRQAGDPLVCMEIITFLGEWIICHVGQIDHKIGVYLAEHVSDQDD